MVDLVVHLAFVLGMFRGLCMLMDSIVRAFLIEEQKIVKKVLKAQQAAAKTK